MATKGKYQQELNQHLARLGLVEVGIPYDESTDLFVVYRCHVVARKESCWLSLRVTRTFGKWQIEESTNISDAASSDIEQLRQGVVPDLTLAD